MEDGDGVEEGVDGEGLGVEVGSKQRETARACWLDCLFMVLVRILDFVVFVVE